MSRKTRGLNTLFIVFLILNICQQSASYAKDFGKVANSFEVKEEGFVAMMLRRLKSVDIEQENTRMQKRAKEVVENPKPVSFIKKAEETKTFYFDPTYVLKQDILLPNGQVLHKAGYRVNPLDHMNLDRRMFFVDGRDKEQIKWLKAKLQETDRNKANNNEGHVENKVILTAGRIFDITKELKKEINFEEVYFDQEGEITTKLGIKAVPAIAEQEEKRIRITEVDIEEDSRD